MNIGKLNRRITLVEMGKTSDGGGGGNPFPIRQFDIWGDFRQTGNRSSEISGVFKKAYDTPVVDETHYVYIRRNSAPQVSRGWQAIFEGITYQILDVDSLHPEYTILRLQRFKKGVI